MILQFFNKALCFLPAAVRLCLSLCRKSSFLCPFGSVCHELLVHGVPVLLAFSGWVNSSACPLPCQPYTNLPIYKRIKATPHNSRLAAYAPLRQLRHGICVAKMLDNIGLRYPHRASGAKAPRTLRPLPLLRFAVSATGGAHLCSIQYYLRFWLGICRTSLAVSALRIMRYCLKSSHRPPA